DVGLAPYHDLDSKVPADVKSKMTQITADIVSGKTKTGWTAPTANCPQGYIRYARPLYAWDPATRRPDGAHSGRRRDRGHRRPCAQGVSRSVGGLARPAAVYFGVARVGDSVHFRRTRRRPGIQGGAVQHWCRRPDCTR